MIVSSFRTARRHLLTAALAAGVAGAFPVLANDAVRDVRIQTALSLRVLKFIDWPPSAAVRRTGTLRLCTVGQSHVINALHTQDGATYGTQEIVVQSITADAPLDVLRNCDALYSALPAGRESAQLLLHLSGLPIVTLSDSENFINQGGTIQFRRFENRYVFDVNLSGAKVVGLKISTPLLRLSAQVY